MAFPNSLDPKPIQLVDPNMLDTIVAIQRFLGAEQPGGASLAGSKLPFSASVPLRYVQADMGIKYVSGPIAFTPDPTDNVRLNFTTVTLIADGGNVPTFTGMYAHSSSLPYENTENVPNTINFWFDGLQVLYQISWATAKVPVPYVNPNPPAAFVRFDLLSHASERAGGSAATGYVYDNVPGYSWDQSWSKTSTLKKAAANVGYLRAVFRQPQSNGSSLGIFLHDIKTSIDLSTVLYGIIGSKFNDHPKGDVNAYGIGGANSATQFPNTLADGDLMQLAWTKTTVMAQFSTDAGATWTTLFTWTMAIGTMLYPYFSTNAGAPVVVGPITAYGLLP